MLRTARGIERGLLVVPALAKLSPGLIDIFVRRMHRTLHGLHYCFLTFKKVLGLPRGFAGGLDVLQAALDGRLDLDRFVTKTISLDEVPEALDELHAQTGVRTVVLL